MIIIACDVCKKQLQPVPQPASKLVYCDRCQPWAEDYEAELQKTLIDIQQEINRRLDRFRNEFIKRHVESPALKAVI